MPHASTLRFPGLYLRLLAEQLARMGVEADPWRRAHGLDDAVLAGPWVDLPAAGLAAAISDAVARSGDAALGLLVGERLAVGTHGVVGHAVVHSRTLGEALDVLVRYAALRMPLLAFERQPDGDGDEWLVVTPLAPLGAAQRPLLDATLLAIHRLLATLAEGPPPVVRVALPHRLGRDRGFATALFGVPVDDGAAVAGLRLAAGAPQRTLPSADPEAFALADRQCREDLARRDGGRTLAERLRGLLSGPLIATADVDVCARLLATSPRSLHRRLAAEGMGFREIVDGVRRERAERLLRDGLRVEDVAAAVGYGDVANFRRAFRRWTGVAPAAWRQGPSG